MSAAKGSKRSSASWSEWRDPLRMTIAAIAAYVLSEAAHLPQGYWSVLTALVVTRPHMGGALKAGAGRLVGTLYGAGLAAIVSMGRIWEIPNVVLLLATLAPLGFLIAWRYEYRTAPIAAVIVLSAGAVGQSSLATAGLRVTEIALGAVVGVGVSVLLFPTRSSRKSELITAALLARLGDLLDLCALPDSAPDCLRGSLKACRNDLRELTIVAVTSSWKKSGRDGSDARTDAARRVLSDVSFIVRVTGLARATGNPALNNEWFQASLRRLRENVFSFSAALVKGTAPSADAGNDPPPPPTSRRSDAPSPFVAQATTLGMLFRMLEKDLHALTQLFARA